MKAANRVMKNTGILYVRMGITVFISLYSTRLILNSLGVDDFGIFNVVAGSIAMLTFLNTTGTKSILISLGHAKASLTSRCSTAPALRACAGQFLSRGFMVLLRKNIP